MHTRLPMLAVQFDLSGVTAWDPLMQPIEPGPHEGIIKDVDPNYNGGKSCKFTIEAKGGAIADIYLGNEPGEKGGNLRKWKLALLAIATANGASEADAEKGLSGKVNVDPTKFKGKKIHILVIEVPGTNVDPTTGRERPNLPDKEFMTKAQYDEAVKAGIRPSRSSAPAPRTNGAAASTQAAAGSTATPSTTPPPAEGSTLDKLFGS